MIPVIAQAVLSVVAGHAVPYIKRILTGSSGEDSGLAGRVIDEIAAAAGVTPETIPDLAKTDPNSLIDAVVITEPEAARLYLESQKLTNESVALDYAKESWFAWAWRPAWMWMLLVFWTHALIIQPFSAAWVPIEPVDVGTLTNVTSVFVAFYMGGHTVKGFIGKMRK